LSAGSDEPGNLTGFWTGVYDYGSGRKEPVPFNVIIEDNAGSLTGEIIEPNTFSPAKDRELFASLKGTREGTSVHFIKTYEKVPRAGHSIAYAGTLDASRTRIDGTWNGTGPYTSATGPFVMNRGSGKKAAVVEEQKAGLELVKTP
jgi:hypothetical protein